MKFCCECGSKLSLKIPPRDNRERFVCDACGYVHYQNPNVVVSCLATWEDKALWMKRADQPRRGFWSVPSGYMEHGESLQQAAARELFEETCVQLPPESLVLYGVGSIITANQVYVSFRAELPSPDFGIGEESLDVALFSEEELPWEEFAFPQIKPAVKNFYREMKTGDFGMYIGEYGQLQYMLERMN